MTMLTENVTSPVLEHELPESIYRAYPALSQSSMKELLVSPAHYMARYGPDAPPFFPSAAMIMGSAIHARVLEPETFDAQFINKSDKPKDLTIPELKEMLDAQGVEYPKAAKKAELEAMAFPGGKPKDQRTSLDAETYDAVLNAAEALRCHDITGQWFCPGTRDYRKNNEVSLFVRNHMGLVLKARLDRVIFDGVTVKILDLKTTHTSSPREFQRTVANFSYDLQAAWYSDLAAKCYPDARAIEFYFCALERKAPHGISVFKASQNLIDSGRQKMTNALEQYAQCTELNYWPGYAPKVHDLDMPAWAKSGEAELEPAF